MPTPTNLYEYYTGQGQSLPSVSARASTAASAGVTGLYTGTAQQNAQVLSYLQKPVAGATQTNTNANVGAVPTITPPNTGATMGQMFNTQTPVPTPSYVNNQDIQEMSRTKDMFTPMSQEEKDATRRDVLARYDRELDATKQVYARKLTEAKLAGQGRLGSQTAMSARGGLIGSDFGNAQEQNVRSSNSSIESDIQNEELQRIYEIQNKAETAVSTEMAFRRESKEKDAESYIKSLTTKKDRQKTIVSNIVTSLLDGGQDIQKLPKAEYQSILEQLKQVGISEGDLTGAYTKEKRVRVSEQAKLDKENQTMLGDGGMLVDRNGNVIAENKKEPEIKTIADGSMGYLFNDKTGQYEMVANNPKGSDTTTPGVYVVGQNPTVDAWADRINAGTAALKDITGDPALKSAVVVALDSKTGGKLSAIQSNLIEAKKIVEELKTHSGRQAATGMPNMLTNPFGMSLPSSNARDFKAKVERLNALLFLNAVPQMKGTGALTEREGSRLESSSSITRNLGIGEQAYVDELTRLGTNLDTSIGNLGGDKENQTKAPPNQSTQGSVPAGKARVTTPEGQQILIDADKVDMFLKENPGGKRVSFNQVGNTSVSKGIVGGVNLKGYAVDPNQIKAVATLYDKVPSGGNEADYDNYIKTVSPKSKVTGRDIMNVANKFQLDPKIMVALMQHESRIGTSNVALANNNFGGITWTKSYQAAHPEATKGTPRPANEGGFYVKFPNVESGLVAQAQLLSKRKIS